MATQKTEMMLVRVSQEDTERANYIYYVVDLENIKNIMKEKSVKISGAITFALYGKGFGELEHNNDYKGSIDYYQDDLMHTILSFDSITKEELKVIEKFINISETPQFFHFQKVSS